MIIYCLFIIHIIIYLLFIIVCSFSFIIILFVDNSSSALKEVQGIRFRASGFRNYGLTTWWSTRVSSPRHLGGYVTQFAPHKALMSIAWRRVDF